MTFFTIKSRAIAQKTKFFLWTDWHGAGCTLRANTNWHGYPCQNGAGGEIRTHDLHLGKVALYQLSYARPAIKEAEYNLTRQSVVKWFLPISIDFHPDHA